MRTIRLKKQFKKDLKAAIRNPLQNVEKLNITVEILKEKGELPQEYLPHKLSGNWGGFDGMPYPT